ncbi:MAG: SUMF1/EgtB/PvdO family nonheme iron enzyme [Pseudomonadota bacterium]
MTQPVRVDTRLYEALEQQFNGLSVRAELGAAILYSGERKVDGRLYDLYLPSSALLADKTRLKTLADTFRRLTQTGSAHLQGHLPLSETVFATSAGRATVLGLVGCPDRAIDDHVDQLSFDQKRAMFLDLLRGLSALHEAGLVHGNLAPPAVRRETPAGGLKLCDLAFALDDPIAITEQPLLYQAPAVMADGKPSVVADLHAAGLIGYRLFLGPNGPVRALTGQDGPVDDTLLRQRISAADAPALRAEDLAPAAGPLAALQLMAPVLARMIGRGTTEPFLRAGAALKAFEGGGYSSGGAEAAAPPPPPTPAPEPTGGGRPRWVVPAAAAAVLLAAGGGYYFYQDRAARMAALDAAFDRCTVSLPVPDGRLSDLQDTLRDALLAAYRGGDVARLEALCALRSDLAALVAPWDEALRLGSAADALLALPETNGLSLPAAAATALDRAKESLERAMAEVTPETPALLTEAVNGMSGAVDDLVLALRTDLGEGLAALSEEREILRIDLEPERLDALAEGVSTAATADALSAVADETVALSQDGRAALGTAWLAEAGERANAVQARLDALPLPVPAAEAARDGRRLLLAATEDLVAAMPAAPRDVLEAWTEIEEKFDAVLAQGEGAAHRAAEAGLRARLQEAEAAFAPETGPIDLVRDAIAKLPAEPRGANLDGALQVFAEAEATLDAAIQEVREVATRARRNADAARTAADTAEPDPDGARASADAAAGTASAAAAAGAWRRAGTEWATAERQYLAAVAEIEAVAAEARLEAEAAAAAAAQADPEPGPTVSRAEEATATAEAAADAGAWRQAGDAWRASTEAWTAATAEIEAEADAARAAAEAAAAAATLAEPSESPSLVAAKDAEQAAASAEEAGAWRGARDAWTAATEAWTAALAEIEAEANAARAAAEAAAADASRAEPGARPAVAQAEDATTGAGSAEEAGAWRRARDAWMAAEEAWRVAVAEIEAEALAAREAALAEKATLGDAVDTSVADQAFDAGQEGLTDGRFGAAKASFTDALNGYLEAETGATTRDFTVGASAEDVAALAEVCRTRSLVQAACSPTPDAGRRQVALAPFTLALTEVSVGAFADFVQQTGYVTDAERLGYAVAVFTGTVERLPGHTWRAPQGAGSTAVANEPVTALSVGDARAYCAHIGGRIPRAAEWEVVARGEALLRFPWGDAWRDGMAVWQGEGRTRRPVDAGPTGPAGHIGLAGNVREWVDATDGSALKGGSWLSVNPADLAGSALLTMTDGAPGVDFGVRCAKDLETWPE